MGFSRFNAGHSCIRMCGMKTRRLALRVTLNSALMLFSVYLVLQVITYFRDNIILGISDLSGLVPSVSRFMLSSVLPPMVVFAALIYLTARPLERMQARLERGERLDEAAAEKVRRRIGGFAGLVQEPRGLAALN